MEYGWFGFVVWIVAGVWTVAAAIKQMYIPAPLQVKFSLLAAFAGWLAMMVYSMFDFPMQVLSLQIYVVVFAGIIWAERMAEIQRIAADQAFGQQIMMERVAGDAADDAGRGGGKSGMTRFEIWKGSGWNGVVEKIPAILLAAGLSSADGGAFKPLLKLGDATLLEHGIRALRGSGVIGEILVVAGHRGEEIRAAVAGISGMRVVVNPDFAAGEMLSSVKCGVGGFAADARASCSRLRTNRRLSLRQLSGWSPGFCRTCRRFDASYAQWKARASGCHFLSIGAGDPRTS